MGKVKLGKPPKDLTQDQLLAWAEEQFEDGYEKLLFDQREKRREAEARAEKAETSVEEMKKQVPDEDSVLLKGDDAKRWKDLKELDVEQLQRQAEEGERVKRRSFLQEVAQEAGFNPKTFAELVELRQLEVTAEDGKDGKAYKVQVEKGDGKKEAVDLVEHFQAEYADWLPALTPQQGTQTQAQQGTTQRRTTPVTGRLPNQTTRRPNDDDPQQRVLQRQRERALGSVNVVQQSLQGAGGETKE